MVTAAEIADYDTEELERQLGDTRRELFNLRFQLATGQLDNFSRINHVRKDVARMLTELRNREIAEAEGMALEELPAHVAAARRRSEDEALGRDQTTASERRAAARAAEEAAEATRTTTSSTRTSWPKRWPTTTAWPWPTTDDETGDEVDDEADEADDEADDDADPEEKN